MYFQMTGKTTTTNKILNAEQMIRGMECLYMNNQENYDEIDTEKLNQDITAIYSTEWHISKSYHYSNKILILVVSIEENVLVISQATTRITFKGLIV